MLASGVACLPQHAGEGVDVAHALGLECRRSLRLTGLFGFRSLCLAGGLGLVCHSFEHTRGCPLGASRRVVLERVVGVWLVVRLLRSEISLNRSLVLLVNYLVTVVVVLRIVRTLRFQQVDHCIQIRLCSLLGVSAQGLGHVLDCQVKGLIACDTRLLILSGLVQHFLFGGADVGLQFSFGAGQISFEVSLGCTQRCKDVSACGAKISSHVVDCLTQCLVSTNTSLLILGHPAQDVGFNVTNLGGKFAFDS